MGKDFPGGGGVPPTAFGCSDPTAFNYCSKCDTCGGSPPFANNCCTYLGCPDPAASNYQPLGNSHGNFNNAEPHPGCGGGGITDASCCDTIDPISGGHGNTQQTGGGLTTTGGGAQTQGTGGHGNTGGNPPDPGETSTDCDYCFGPVQSWFGAIMTSNDHIDLRQYMYKDEYNNDTDDFVGNELFMGDGTTPLPEECCIDANFGSLNPHPLLGIKVVWVEEDNLNKCITQDIPYLPIFGCDSQLPCPNNNGCCYGWGAGPGYAMDDRYLNDVCETGTLVSPPTPGGGTPGCDWCFGDIISWSVDGSAMAGQGMDGAGTGPKANSELTGNIIVSAGTSNTIPQGCCTDTIIGIPVIWAFDGHEVNNIPNNSPRCITIDLNPYGTVGNPPIGGDNSLNSSYPYTGNYKELNDRIGQCGLVTPPPPPPDIIGCMDDSAINYDPNATLPCGVSAGCPCEYGGPPVDLCGQFNNDTISSLDPYIICVDCDGFEDWDALYQLHHDNDSLYDINAQLFTDLANYVNPPESGSFYVDSSNGELILNLNCCNNIDGNSGFYTSTGGTSFCVCQDISDDVVLPITHSCIDTIGVWSSIATTINSNLVLNQTTLTSIGLTDTEITTILTEYATLNVSTNTLISISNALQISGGFVISHNTVNYLQTTISGCTEFGGYWNGDICLCKPDTDCNITLTTDGVEIITVPNTYNNPLYIVQFNGLPLDEDCCIQIASNQSLPWVFENGQCYAEKPENCNTKIQINKEPLDLCCDGPLKISVWLNITEPNRICEPIPEEEDVVEPTPTETVCEIVILEDGSIAEVSDVTTETPQLPPSTPVFEGEPCCYRPNVPILANIEVENALVEQITTFNSSTDGFDNWVKLEANITFESSAAFKPCLNNNLFIDFTQGMACCCDYDIKFDNVSIICDSQSDKIKVTEPSCVGFDIHRVIDNKKSWVYNPSNPGYTQDPFDVVTNDLGDDTLLQGYGNINRTFAPSPDADIPWRYTDYWDQSSVLERHSNLVINNKELDMFFDMCAVGTQKCPDGYTLSAGTETCKPNCPCGWEDISNPIGNHTGLSFINNSTGWMCDYEGKVHKTTDGAQSWTTTTNGIITTGVTFAVLADIQFIDELTGYTCGNLGRVYKTIDGGISWTAIDLPVLPVFSINYHIEAMFFLNENEGWVGLGTSISGGPELWHTNDAGTSWTFLSAATVTANAHISIPPASPRVFGGIYFRNSAEGKIVTTNSILTTSDSGNTWTVDSGTIGQFGFGSVTRLGMRIEFIDDNRGWVAASGGVYYTTSWNGDWTLSPITGAFINDISFVDSDNGVAVGLAGDTYRTRDGGISWFPECSEVWTNNLSSVQMFSESHGFAAGWGTTLPSLPFSGDVGTILEYKCSSTTIKANPFACKTKLNLIELENYKKTFQGFWIQFVEQFVPATTIWVSGERWCNSVENICTEIEECDYDYELVASETSVTVINNEVMSGPSERLAGPNPTTSEKSTIGIYSMNIITDSANSSQDQVVDFENLKYRFLKDELGFVKTSNLYLGGVNKLKQNMDNYKKNLNPLIVEVKIVN